MDALKYTRSELEKELVLLEKHLKQHSYIAPDFCTDCSLKHWSAIEGLAEEGIGFAGSEGDKSTFMNIAAWAKKWRAYMPRTEDEFKSAYEETRSMRKDILIAPFNALLKEPGTFWSITHSSNPSPIEKPINLLGMPKGEEKRMPISRLEALSVIGSEFAAKFGDRGLIELDRVLGKEDAPLIERWRTWLSPILGAGFVLGSYFGLKGWARTDRRKAAQLGLVAFGAGLATQSVESGEEAIVGGLEVAGEGGGSSEGTQQEQAAIETDTSSAALAAV